MMTSCFFPRYCSSLMRRIPQCPYYMSRTRYKFKERVYHGFRCKSDSSRGLPTEQIRNIGIMAHVDAGKTTTTERMLFYSGTTRHLGDVDSGDTVTDYLPQERDRGITITSAVVTFFWEDHRINLIDTPGHVDFTMEVERSLRVLDGAVAIFDASAGVEAQSLTVWEQANHHNIPRICFLNKMDKPGASVDLCITSIRDKLKTTPLLLQLPIGRSLNFAGVVDLLTMETVNWQLQGRGSDGSVFSRAPVADCQDANLLEEINTARLNLVEQVADLDDEFAGRMLDDSNFSPLQVSSEELISAIRRITLANVGVPILCGSSLKNKGVQLLMDAVNGFLPSPALRKDHCVQAYGSTLCAYAFKVIHDRQRGPLVFLRIYSGTIKPQSAVHNASRNCTERVTRLLYVLGDSYREVSHMADGNIAVATGLKQTVTGDTLVASKAAYNIAKAKFQEQTEGQTVTKRKRKEASTNVPLLESIQVPEPVFFCTVEPPSQAYQADLEKALECLQREDPSLQVKTDSNTGQLILMGMGELHLDIIQDRIKKEYKIDVELGPLQISYRESITGTAAGSATLDKMLGNRQHFCTVTVSIHPLEDHTSPVQIEVKGGNGTDRTDEMTAAAQDGALSACHQGPLLGVPVLGVGVTVDEMSIAPGTSPTIVAACSSQAVSDALSNAGGCLMEPVMKVEVTTDDDRSQSVLGDLARRRAEVMDVVSRAEKRVVVATTPLSEMLGYSTSLRSLTSGTASCSLEFSTYKVMTQAEQNAVIMKLGGL